MRQPYSTDLNDEQWALIAPYFPPPKPGGRPRLVDLREVVNAILYILMGGIAWRLLPHDFPKWQTVYHYFRQWRDDGTLKKFIKSSTSGSGQQDTTDLHRPVMG